MVSTLRWFLALLILSTFACAFPHVKNGGVSVPLVRRAHKDGLSNEEKRRWASHQAQKLITKYGSRAASSTLNSRASGTNDIINHNSDSSYFGSLAIGTPAQAFNVILDTGSADLWLASSACLGTCDRVSTLDTSSSSSFSNLSTSFFIQYGSGQASGILAQDTVQMAGFSVSNQTYGLVNTVSAGLLSNPVSGILGLGFQSIASSRAVPFWQALVQGNAWDQPLFSFYLTRFINASRALSQEPGGRFTMGFVDESLYTGEIEYIDIPAGQEGYWILPMTDLSVNGLSVDVGDTAQASYSAIDTGTTLVGGPPGVISQIFAAIPGSAPATGNFAGYYSYPCGSEIYVSLSFGGGQAWTVDPADFLLMQLSEDSCLGAFFALETGDSAPSWIIGDTFLKNVYTVFRYSPASVGFANISGAAQQLALAGKLPSQTIGADPVTATGVNSAAHLSLRTTLNISILITVLRILL